MTAANVLIANEVSDVEVPEGNPVGRVQQIGDDGRYHAYVRDPEPWRKHGKIHALYYVGAFPTYERAVKEILTELSATVTLRRKVS